MTVKNNPPAAIEGRKIEITSQKITPSGGPKRTCFRSMVFPITVEKRGKGIIIQEVNPKRPRCRDYSMLDAGDGIHGRRLWGFSTLPITRSSIGVGGKRRTGKHSGQNVMINGTFCFLEIVSGWRGKNLPVHPKQQFLQSSSGTPEPL
ncbi:MAG: hypothetical protein JRJ29_18065 [Deltaproteobacteria bacterium]|nr:hypothetical protein [Deltaproteobacteria bacterium]